MGWREVPHTDGKYQARIALGDSNTTTTVLKGLAENGDARSMTFQLRRLNSSANHIIACKCTVEGPDHTRISISEHSEMRYYGLGPGEVQAHKIWHGTLFMVWVLIRLGPPSSLYGRSSTALPFFNNSPSQSFWRLLYVTYDQLSC